MKREESRALQGIAVLLMLFHHFFIYAWLFDDVPGFLRYPGVTERLAWCGRICVGIFSFVSGYGMHHVLKEKTTWKEAYAACGRRILKLYASLWLTLGVCLALWRVAFHEAIRWRELPGNITALDPTYNSTWWFVREYLWMLLLVPFGKMILSGKKRQKITALLVCVSGILAVAALFLIPGGRAVADGIRSRVEVVFLIIFAEGYLTAQFLGRFLEKTERRLGRATAPAGFLIVAVAVAVRYLTTPTPDYAWQDILVVPLFISGMVLILRGIPILTRAAGYFGRHSLFLWLVHGLVWQRTFVFAKSLGEPAGYYLFELLLSLGVTYGMEGIRYGIVTIGKHARGSKKGENG